MNPFPHTHSLLVAGALLAGVTTAPVPAQGIGGGLEAYREDASLADRIGNDVPRDIELTDSRGYPLTLRQFFPGDRPVLLNLVYYHCPDMCGTVMKGMVDALREVDLRPGEDFEILTVSFDPSETAEIAATHKERWLPSYRKAGDGGGWHFAVADQENVDALSEAVGFRHVFLEKQNRFDHPAALIFLSPQGKVTRYLTGLSFDPGDLRLALVEASEGELGGFWDVVKLSCLTFDSSTSRFTLTAFTVVKIVGGLVVVALATMIIWLLRKERQRAAHGHRAGGAEPHPSSP